jgi:preprotein translocase subunit SecB
MSDSTHAEVRDQSRAEQPDSQKAPGFHFNSVAVDKLNLLDLQPGETRPPSLNFSIKFRRRMLTEPAGVEITVLVSISPQEGSSFRFDVEITGQFDRVDGPQVLALEDFARLNGPALVMPYAREIVTNITSRTRHGVILFPPVNIVQLVMEEEQLEEEEEGSTPSEPPKP